MNEFIIPSLYFLSGVCAYACFIHLSTGLRRQFDLTQILFGLMCLVISVFAIFHSLTFRAKEFNEFIIALKWSLSYLILFNIFFLWFIAFFSKTYPFYFLLGLSMVFGLLLWVNMDHPFSLQFASINSLKSLTLDWGETLTLAEGQVDDWAKFAFAIVLLGFIYIFYALQSFYRQNRHRYILGMMAAVGFFMLCSMEGLLVRLSVIDSAPLGVYGFLGMIITMGLILNREYDQQLRESEEKLRGLYELSPLGIALTDMKGRFIDFNEAFRRISGYTSNELRNLDYWALTPKEYELQEAKQLDSLIHVGHYGPYEKEYMNKSGDRVPLRLNGMLVTGSDGQRYIWSIVENISAGKPAAKAFNASEEQFRLLVETSSQAILSLDKTFRILFVNSAMARMLGYTPEYMRGRLEEEFVFDEDVSRYRREMQLRVEGQSTHYELRFRRNDGGLCWCSIIGVPLKDNQGHFAAAFALYTEITDRKPDA